MSIEQNTRGDSDHTARAAADSARRQGADEAEQLRYQQHHHAEPEKRHHQRDVEPRPSGKQLKVVTEVLGSDQARLDRQREADADHHQP
jgi:hypothetical protein